MLAGMFGASSLEAQVRRLFAGGVPGFQLDLIHKSNLYQDAARTTLVSAHGDPIGSPTDLSGNDKHPTQSTTTSRALYQGYAALDGADDSWVTPAIDFTGTDAVTIVAALRKNSDTTPAIVVELSTNTNGSQGAFYVSAPQASGGANYGIAARGSVLPSTLTANGFAAPVTSLVSAFADISSSNRTLRVNGVQVATSSDSMGTGNFRNYVAYIGRRAGASLPFNGGLAGLTVIGRAVSGPELALLERYGNFLKTGLPA